MKLRGVGRWDSNHNLVRIESLESGAMNLVFESVATSERHSLVTVIIELRPDEASRIVNWQNEQPRKAG